MSVIHKVHLLEAEILSSEGKNGLASASYTAAIVSAQNSCLIHEQGLACELAGAHYKRVGDYGSAFSLLNQAKQCYENWGSQMKVDSVSRQLESFHIGSS